MAMRRGRTAVLARRRMRRGRGSWKVKARRTLGAPKNFSTAKTNESAFPGTVRTCSRNQFVVAPLIIISGDNSNAINDRQRDVVNLSGIRIDATFLNVANFRLYVNWAVIHPKHKIAMDGNDTDIFRDYREKRAWDATSVLKTGLSWSTAEINSDEYTVLRRGKFMLTPNNTGPAVTRYNYGAATKEKSLWVPIKRQITFDSNTDTAPQDQVYFCVWCGDPNDGAGNSLGLGIDWRLRAITYFREVK